MSGVRYGIKMQWLPQDMGDDQRRSHLMARVNYFSKILQISRYDQIESLFKRYWFIAPLGSIEHAAKLLESATGKQGISVDIKNTTERDSYEVSNEIAEEFRARSSLDMAIYQYACAHFDALIARQSGDRTAFETSRGPRD